jgi:hypothetical protein
VYSMVQRREKEKDSRYIQEASAPAAVTVYQTCNIMYICNTENRKKSMHNISVITPTLHRHLCS